jgi:hypothetical protein
LKPCAFKLQVNLYKPHHEALLLHDVVQGHAMPPLYDHRSHLVENRLQGFVGRHRRRRVGWHSLPGGVRLVT